ncbi:hypothetical protein TNCV_1241151 [Trichonephila clavipes]|uniref:Uncharacterized protein n=1 Tax=Trichonephila clavipes TaxID=2585209 RepID=A0A8X6WED8_TRICX|nr:hypothetical protein TNCV_1241151 [Trichonephila clavipes]
MGHHHTGRPKCEIISMSISLTDELEEPQTTTCHSSKWTFKSLDLTPCGGIWKTKEIRFKSSYKIADHSALKTQGVKIRNKWWPGKVLELILIFGEAILNTSCTLNYALSSVKYLSPAEDKNATLYGALHLLVSHDSLLTFEEYQGTTSETVERSSYHDTPTRSSHCAYKARSIQARQI